MGNLSGFSSAGLSPLLAQCCTTESAPDRRLLAFDRKNEKLLSRKFPALNSTPINNMWVGSVNKKPFDQGRLTHAQICQWHHFTSY